MASMNYCFTVCRATDENAQHRSHINTASQAIDVPQSSSPANGAYFFGRFFSFGSSSSSSSPTSTFANRFLLKASDVIHDDDNLA
ncbi:unnamed protein product [Adineta ricciae]|uniref:Uncharacterized protein n=1 Tax=Adineta ricciae TaxID=249248 RepID=A0A814BQA2_ADIRI|nr:unnamed protein product [Adineta ricciae]CAF0929671.1 unnamed protein product [Adineta ricciae]